MNRIKQWLGRFICNLRGRHIFLYSRGSELKRCGRCGETRQINRRVKT